MEGGEWMEGERREWREGVDEEGGEGGEGERGEGVSERGIGLKEEGGKNILGCPSTLTVHIGAWSLSPRRDSFQSP